MEKAQGSPYWLRVGIILVITTMLYNVVEAGIALWAGVEAASIALIEFGSNSVIEIVAASVLIWRLRLEARGADSERVARADLVVPSLCGPVFYGSRPVCPGPVRLDAVAWRGAERELYRHAAGYGLTHHHAAGLVREVAGGHRGRQSGATG